MEIDPTPSRYPDDSKPYYLKWSPFSYKDAQEVKDALQERFECNYALPVSEVYARGSYTILCREKFGDGAEKNRCIAHDPSQSCPLGLTAKETVEFLREYAIIP